MQIVLKKNIPEGIDKYDTNNPTHEPDVELEKYTIYTYSFNKNGSIISIRFNLSGIGDTGANYMITCSHETCIQFFSIAMHTLIVRVLLNNISILQRQKESISKMTLLVSFISVLFFILLGKKLNIILKMTNGVIMVVVT